MPQANGYYTHMHIWSLSLPQAKHAQQDALIRKLQRGKLELEERLLMLQSCEELEPSSWPDAVKASMPLLLPPAPGFVVDVVD